ncbi:PTS lactose/cellobiose transporter subunit IIA [Tetragenococcus koreensis]|uniref:PTS lactose/cellobiose transporter subunit IIA n=1 Tax=Tetragenococcus koreensis TaxID=290335 RepID=UPI000F4E09C6|nr:PTS lactose/cellobiose transporter subunit IIA [Tetragenococcus koreensis]AYW44826.1 PTS lactose/cellobiose transporter subunit IIA [Tetragenococcus koreensis]GEN90397.1 PTS cellobiose transporter subunit IIA [Tetragenococcus koreensis]
MEEEQIIMQLISNGGNARASSIKAVQKARQGDFPQSETLLKQAKESLTIAHNVQTELIQQEIREQSDKTTLLMVHAQDHLMNAITVNDLAKEFIEYMKKGWRY